MENLETAAETARPVAPPTLRAHVVKMLSADILAGRYKPGDRLNESQIARELNISRIPVREALSQLQEQGLVQNRERRGMFVTHIGPEEVLQISSLRIVLETEALRLARLHMTAEILAQLEVLMGQMEAWNGTLAGSRRPGPGIPPRHLDGDRQSLSGAGAECADGAAVRAQDAGACHPGNPPLAAVHHRILLDVVAGRSDDDPQEALLTHMRMSYTEPERYSTLAKPPAKKAQSRNCEKTSAARCPLGKHLTRSLLYTDNRARTRAG